MLIGFQIYFLNEKKVTYNKSKLTPHLLLLDGVVDVGESALAAVLPIKVGSHEDAGTTFLTGALTTQTVDLAVVVDAVVL